MNHDELIYSYVVDQVDKVIQDPLRFYLSLEDDLMRLFGSDRVAAIMDRIGVAEGEVIAAGMVTRAISNSQKKVETRNFGIRKHLLEYDDVMNQQRQVVYDIRNQSLHGTEHERFCYGIY